MSFSTCWYCLKQGLKNICRNIWFSLASVATISACIFLFCLFFSIVANIRFMVHHVESTVGITVLFDESLTEEQILALGDEIGKRPEIREMKYVSAQEAWDSFKAEYFAGHEELAEGFAEDNPLAGSASYVIFLNDISEQENFVAYLQGITGVRQAVAVFLISNTISVAAAFRRRESQIMRLIGATNFMIRAPFIVEGVVIGLIGAVIPLAGMYVLYTRMVVYLMERFHILSNMLYFIPIGNIYPVMVAVSMALGVGIGFFGSFFTIRRSLKV